jgi:Tol biopolymer transport system component
MRSPRLFLILVAGIAALLLGGATAAGGARSTHSIVYLSNWAPHFRTAEIYTLTRSGGRPHDLTNNELDDLDPSWSPDGHTIVFASLRGGDFDLYLMSAGGGSVRRLLALPGDQRQPVWSPDGDTIAFVSRGADRNEKGWQPNQLFLVNVDGSGLRQLTHLENGAADPAWSPDGRTLAASDGSIFTINADGSGFHELPPSVETDGDAHPSWSPDGEWIAFDRYEIDFSTTDVWLMNAGGSGQRRLLRFGGQPAWSPDGRRIAFVNGDVWSCDREGCVEEGLAAVAWVAANGGRRHYLTRPLVRSGEVFGSPEKWMLGDDVSYFGLHWSSDGRRLLFARRLEQRLPDLFAVGARGGTPKRLTTTSAVEKDPLVSPDGRHVMYERFPLGGGAPAVLLAGLAAGRPRLLAHHGRVGAWSRDGRELAYLGKVELGGPRPPTIYVARGDGAHRQALVRGFSPSWSPDGNRLAFLEASKPRLGIADTISLVDRDGGGRRRLLIQPRRRIYGLAWSPTGAWLSFVSASRSGQTLATRLELLNVATGRSRAITRGSFGDDVPVWSPDGGLLAFTRRPRSPYGTLSAVVVSRWDGRGAHRLGKWRWREALPAWSPDGSRLVFASMRNGNYQITTATPDGRHRRVLTTNLADNIEPSW